MSLIMRNNGKNIETKLPQLGINIKILARLAGLALIFFALYIFGATIPTVIGIYLGYKILRLILRVFGLIVSLLISVASIVVLTAIISLLIF